MVTHIARLWNCLAVMLLLACATSAAHAQDYDGAIQRCTELVEEFDEQATGIQHEVQAADQSSAVGVRVTWRRSDAAASGVAEGWIVCFFVPLAQTGGAWQIDMMDTQKYGKLRRYDVQQLYKLRWLNQNFIPKLEEGPTPPPPPHIFWLYVLQQTINALTLGCLYALLAVGFTIIYDVTRAVNLAFGDLYMVGAFVTYICYVVVAANGGSFDWLTAAIVLLLAVGTCATASWVTDRVGFRYMRHGPTTVPMIASIGVALILRDVVRLSQGPKTRWMPPSPGASWRFLEGYGYDIYLRKGHVAIGLATAAVAFGFWWIGRHTKFGRGYRAAAQDPGMAGLLGIDVSRTIGVSFLIAGAMTGVAGVFAALQYQVVDFYMGYLIGFKALTAALLGGIGSLQGAFLGGILIALVETYAGMTFGYEWREIAVFSILALVLIFRPAGLFGTLKNTPADERV